MDLRNQINMDLPRRLALVVLCDQLLTLAEDAEQAALPVAANHLLYLALQIIDNPTSLKGSARPENFP